MGGRALLAAEERRLGLDVSGLTFTPGKKERGDWRRGEERSMAHYFGS